MSIRARNRVLLLALAPLTAAFAQPGRAGAELRGRALFADSTTIVPGIVVAASDASGAVVRALTNERGEYLLRLSRAGRYDVRALRIGFLPTVLPPITLAAGETRVLDIVVREVPVSLAAVTVRGESVCGRAPESGQAVIQLWEQARTALAATTIGAGDARIMAAARLFERTLDARGIGVSAETSTVVRGATLRPFASVSPDSFAIAGYVTNDPSGTHYRAPDADVLLSESFATSHCLWTEPAPPDHPEWVGIGVRAVRERKGIAEIKGTLWLDRSSSELRLFDYLYTGLAKEVERANPGGRVEFQRLPTGNWIVSRWVIRMPQMVIMRSVQGIGVYGEVDDRPVVQAMHERGGETIDVRRDSVVLYRSETAVLAAGERGAPSSQPSTAFSLESQRVRGAGAVLSGRVTQAGDSAVVVAGAEVQIVGSGAPHWADNRGRFTFSGVAPGSYELRVRILGYQPYAGRVEIEQGRLYDRHIELARVAHALTEVRIEGRMIKVPARFEDVYRRGARGLGTFITHEEIYRLNPTETKALFQRVPGVLVNDRGLTFQRCQAGLSGLMASQSGGGASGKTSARSAATVAMQAPKVQVYIDGVRMTNPGNVQMDGPLGNMSGPDADKDADHILRLVPPTSIEAIEVYTGVARIPAEFLDDACAVIAIWTKAH